VDIDKGEKKAGWIIKKKDKKSAVLVDLYEFGIKLLNINRRKMKRIIQIATEESVRKAVAKSGDTPRVE